MKSICCLALGAALLFTGCVIATFYTAPDTLSVPLEYYSRVIDKPFDQTWSALLQYTGSAYFDIQQCEKQSGLFVLSYTGSKPGDFVTGGRVKLSGAMHFDGDYVDYCVVDRGGFLENKVNVFVVPVDSSKTKVTVRVHYVFSCGNPDGGSDVWTFDTGTSDTRDERYVDLQPGQTKARTMVPTYKAERGILDALESAK